MPFLSSPIIESCFSPRTHSPSGYGTAAKNANWTRKCAKKQPIASFIRDEHNMHRWRSQRDEQNTSYLPTLDRINGEDSPC
mmetsp:Transcript_53395/g.113440  ORF Transcript_53395/g.113440 Transcript_53395/m.113440 type:complete len:81 (+) Transcript_53395:129-371(+)